MRVLTDDAYDCKIDFYSKNSDASDDYFDLDVKYEDDDDNDNNGF
jgi:hypothetical protein